MVPYLFLAGYYAYAGAWVAATAWFLGTLLMMACVAVWVIASMPDNMQENQGGLHVRGSSSVARAIDRRAPSKAHATSASARARMGGPMGRASGVRASTQLRHGDNVDGAHKHPSRAAPPRSPSPSAYRQASGRPTSLTGSCAAAAAFRFRRRSARSARARRSTRKTMRCTTSRPRRGGARPTSTATSATILSPVTGRQRQCRLARASAAVVVASPPAPRDGIVAAAT